MEEITNKDLHYIVKGIEQKLTDIKEKDLPEINARVKTTNGSVAEIKSWKERMTGAGFVLLLIVVPILSWALYQIVALNNKAAENDQKIKQEIQNGLKEALSEYKQE